LPSAIFIVYTQDPTKEADLAEKLYKKYSSYEWNLHRRFDEEV